jgi:hypothetical protein
MFSYKRSRIEISTTVKKWVGEVACTRDSLCYLIPSILVYFKQQPSAATEGATSQHARSKEAVSKSLLVACYSKALAQSQRKRSVRRSEKLLPPTLARNLALRSPWFTLKTQGTALIPWPTPVQAILAPSPYPCL